VQDFVEKKGGLLMKFRLAAYAGTIIALFHTAGAMWKA
jgi:hypothetical protein